MTLLEFLARYKAIIKAEKKARCFYCGRLMRSPRNIRRKKCTRGELQTQEHVLPRSTHGQRYTVPACVSCNNSKRNMSPIQFKQKRGVRLFYCEVVVGIKFERLDNMDQFVKEINDRNREKKIANKKKSRVLNEHERQQSQAGTTEHLDSGQQ